MLKAALVFPILFCTPSWSAEPVHPDEIELWTLEPQGWCWEGEGSRKCDKMPRPFRIHPKDHTFFPEPDQQAKIDGLERRVRELEARLKKLEAKR